MEKGSSMDLKKPSTLSIFSPYMVDKKLFCACVCVRVWMRGRVGSQMSLLWDLHICLDFFNDSKIHANPFLFLLSTLPSLLQALCSPSFYTSGLLWLSPYVVPICEGRRNCWHFSLVSHPPLDRASSECILLNCYLLIYVCIYFFFFVSAYCECLYYTLNWGN